MSDVVSSEIFLAVVWEKARMFEKDIRADIAMRFKLLAETECFWPRKDFTKKLAVFYGWQDRFCWWNKARKCGRGAFRVFVFEVENPHFAKRGNSYGRETLVETGVFDAKNSWRHLTKHRNRVHASLNAEETDSEARVLFGKPLEEWLSSRAGYGKPSPERIEALLAEGACARLGIGSRRACYAIPGTDLCLKCYRKAEDVTDATVKREILRYAHDERRNTCCQEYRYYCELKRRLPPDLFAVFPEGMQTMYLPTRGWAVVENVVRAQDGGEVRHFAPAYWDADEGTRASLLAAFIRLIDGFARQAVRFYDPQNILVQTTRDGFRLRIVDFEPAARTFIPLEGIFPFLIRGKVWRRARRCLWTQLGVKI